MDRALIDLSYVVHRPLPGDQAMSPSPRGGPNTIKTEFRHIDGTASRRNYSCDTTYVFESRCISIQTQRNYFSGDFSFLSMIKQTMFTNNYVGCLFALYVVFMCYYSMRDTFVYTLSDTDW